MSSSLAGFNAAILKVNNTVGRIAVSNSNRLSVKAAMEVDISKVGCCSLSVGNFEFIFCIEVYCALILFCFSSFDSGGRFFCTLVFVST